MNFAALFKIAVLLVSTDVARSQWTTCSRTCGQGTRYRKCTADERPKCRIKYEDCTLKHCPSAGKCCDNEMWRYHTTSECCKKVDSKSCGVVQIKKVARRVVGGQVSVDGQWPWMAALWQRKTPQVYFCSGALVNNRWVVTAAHCFVDLKLTAKDVVVKIGMRTQKGPSPHLQASDILEFIPYPNYHEWNDDIALIKLKKTIQYTTYVHPICMPSSEQLQQDTICYVAGWGYATNAAAYRGDTSNELRHADLRVLPLDACKEAYSGDPSYVGVTENTTCAGHHAGGKDSCGGDSGSPLVCQRKTSCQWYLAGVAAFGAKDCGKKNSPGVYTNVQRYEDWITDQITSHPCKSFPCKNDGTCIRLPDDKYLCRCNYPYVGTNCERRLCEPNPCRNKGKCSITPQGIRYISKCTCPSGYRGDRCEISICMPNPCRNGGKCSITPQGTAKCTCTIAYKGERCQTGRWSEWQPCSKSCGGGTRFKVDWCRFNEYTSCPKTYGDCNTQSCNALSACPVGYRFRYEDPSSCCKVVHEKCGIDVGAKPRSRRVIGGTKATQGEMPWAFQVAFLRRRDKLIHCGGALLNKRWVVTAGHCFEYPNDVYVLLGSVTTTDPASGHETREVVEYKVHPQYSYPANNIALVKLNKNVKYSDGIKPICLPTGEITPVDKTCVLGGWGYTNWTDRGSRKNHLHQVKVRTLPLDACIEGYKREYFDPIILRVLDNTQHMCAGMLSGGIGGCIGDGGAPLLCQRCSTCGWYLAGISSVGPRRCGKAGVPDIYTNVYNYQNWIRQQISLSATENFVC